MLQYMKHLNEIVDQVYVINLDRRADRMDQATAEMEKYGIEFERFSGVDGSTLHDAPDTVKYDMACSMSHMNVLKDAKQRQFNVICVFEDDAELSEDFNEKLEPAFNELPANWGLFYLGANNKKPPTKITESVYRVNCSLTTHAYLISNIYQDITRTVKFNIRWEIDNELYYSYIKQWG